MNPGGLHWLAYPWGGGRERIVRIGDDGATPLLLLAPLLEEANRTRHFLIQTMHGLAGRGFCCFLPDLPGTLESSVPIEQVSWNDWHDALACARAAIGRPFHLASFRGGALLDGAVEASSRWRLAPAAGESLVRELIRTKMAADREDGQTKSAAALEVHARSEGLEVSGYRLNAGFVSGLKTATSSAEGSVRSLRLESDPLPADARIAGTPLWRRIEPSHDPVLSQYVVNDIVEWISTCANG
ncbi:hypothetical protein [Sphingomonas cavernae]|uniref:Uncharacterized protein n=1 Tax=Sphingomonas cavernae TaxID=2320861 RepID=A0A418WN59_9SPHN|nr:hypothetical protein [Sphingomonas cavernae]RJF91431.1 hypothetical protein D3876_15170 [Sphingomonas cavernae]